jgi:hypothetical protein
MLRWWDGSQWTEHRAPAAPGGSAPPGGDPAGAPPTYSTGPAQGYGSYPQQGGAYPQQGWGPRQGGFSGPRQMRGPFGMRASGANTYAWTTIGIGAAYIALALSTGFVLIGFLPLVFAARSRQRREPLAPLAIAAAVLVIASAIYFISRHHT